MNIKYYYKYLIGFVLGVTLFGGCVYATIKYSANEFYYDKNNSTLTSSNVQGAIDELANKYSTLASCPSTKVCVPKKSTLAIGDYVSYTPIKTSYTTDIEKTGYTSTQIINPSELNLWRVISIKSNGTVEIISENVSTTSVYFRGQTGFQNFVGYLNVLASQYETPGITVGSRIPGYNGQTQYITDTSKFTSTAPWTCSTGGSCNPVESQGGGDSLYTPDYNLITSLFGNGLAREPGVLYSTAYWVASRNYSYSSYSSSTYYYWSGRYITNTGTGNVSTSTLYNYSKGNPSTTSSSNALRPILTLSSSITCSGLGTKEHPMEVFNK